MSEFERIDEQVIQQFDAQSEEVKFAAAFALGNICVGNIPRYLPLIFQQIRENPKRRYLLLHALKEVKYKQKLTFLVYSFLSDHHAL